MAFILFDEQPDSAHPVGEVRLDRSDLVVRARIEPELERVGLDKTARATSLRLTPLRGG